MNNGIEKHSNGFPATVPMTVITVKVKINNVDILIMNKQTTKAINK